MVEKGKLNEPGPVAVVRPGAGFTQGWDPRGGLLVTEMHIFALVVSKCLKMGVKEVLRRKYIAK